MNLIDIYRLLRRHWVLVAFLTLLGAIAGLASVLLESDDAPDVAYWAGGQVLVVEPGSEFDLIRNAPLAVLGPVPDSVASELDVGLDSLGLRAVSDTAAGTIAVSAVGTDPAATIEVSERVADALIDALDAESQAEFDALVSDLNAEAETQLEVLETSQGEIDIINEVASGLGPEEELTAAQADRLRRATVQRDAAAVAYNSALGELNRLTREGPAPAPVSKLQIVPPIRISEREFSQRLDEAEQALNSFTDATLIDEAAPAVGDGPLGRPAVRMVFGGLAGFIIAVMVVLTYARLDTRLRSRDDFESAFGLPVLTEIPSFKRSEVRDNVLHAQTQPYSRVTEAHRYLRSVLTFSDSAFSESPDEEPDEDAATGGDSENAARVIMVTSAEAGDGKTTTAANLAVVLAEAGYRTILMNCDHRRPRLHELFDVPYAPETLSTTDIDGLSLVTDVHRSPDETPARLSELQRYVITNARDVADVVLLDTSPILATNDALDLLPVTDLVFVVGRSGRTNARAAAEASDLLVERMGAPVLGIVVTASAGSHGERYYDRRRYGGYYDHDRPESPAPGEKASADDERPDADDERSDAEKDQKVASAVSTERVDDQDEGNEQRKEPVGGTNGTSDDEAAGAFVAALRTSGFEAHDKDPGHGTDMFDKATKPRGPVKAASASKSLMRDDKSDDTAS